MQLCWGKLQGVWGIQCLHGCPLPQQQPLLQPLPQQQPQEEPWEEPLPQKEEEEKHGLMLPGTTQPHMEEKGRVRLQVGMEEEKGRVILEDLEE